MSILPVADQDTTLSDALGQHYDRITQFLAQNANPGPRPGEIGRAALASAFGGDYQGTISDLVSRRQQSEAANLSAQGDALNLLVKRNELLASQGHPAATALKDALSTVGFSGWTPQQQQAVLQGIHEDSEQLGEMNALDMVIRHSQGLDFSEPMDVPSGYQETEGGLEFIPGGPADPRVAASLRAPVQPRDDKLVQVMVDGVPTWLPESQASGMPVGSGANEGMAFTGQGTMRLPDGSLTLSRFNKAAGSYEISTDAGWVPAPPGAVMVTESSVSNTKFTAKQLSDQQQELVNDENSLKNLNRFMGTVSDVRTGYRQLADQFTGMIKTVMGEQNLSPDEFAALVMKGQLQTLLGQNRLAIVGGGVMTEYDAQRVLLAVMGAQGPGGIINPELVASNLEFLFEQKKNNYRARAALYNNAVIQGQQVGDPLYNGLPLFDPSSIEFASPEMTIDPEKAPWE